MPDLPSSLTIATTLASFRDEFHQNRRVSNLCECVLFLNLHGLIVINARARAKIPADAQYCFVLARQTYIHCCYANYSRARVKFTSRYRLARSRDGITSTCRAVIIRSNRALYPRCARGNPSVCPTVTPAFVSSRTYRRDLRYAGQIYSDFKQVYPVPRSFSVRPSPSLSLFLDLLTERRSYERNIDSRQKLNRNAPSGEKRARPSSLFTTEGPHT